MFETMIDPVMERIRPHAISTRDACMMFATGVIERLDRIADAVSIDEVYEVRRPVQGTGAAPVTIEVPSTDSWVLESVVARTNPAAAATLDIRDQNGGALRFAQDIPASGGLTANFAPLHFNGGSVLVATLSAPGEFRMVFRLERPRPSRNAHGTGFGNGAPDREDATDEAMRNARHFGGFSLAHRNPQGAHPTVTHGSHANGRAGS
jgi:hypothetical protein